MRLRAFLHARRQRKARERDEHKKALRERQQESSPENVADAVKGHGFRAWGEASSRVDSPDPKKRRS